MNVNVQDRMAAGSGNASRLLVADCDLHPVIKSTQDLVPWLDARWIKHLATYGALRRQGYQQGSIYPKGQPDAARRDAWPEGGGRAGSSLELMQRQHLDPNNVQLGILNALGAGQAFQQPELAAAYCHAINEWLVAEWTAKDKRLKASIVVPYNNAAASVAEIEKRASDPNFVQVFFLSRAADPLGNQRYWPIYEAAEAAGLPIGIHAFGYSGFPVTGSGWPSFYIEEVFGHSLSMQTVVTSLLLEGVFERFPKLKFVIIEAGVSWLASLTWRLDTHWARLRGELPHLKRLPSEYIRDHVWISTQPIEEPEPREHLLETLGWIGWDRVCFASDYPHWDFDDPMHALPLNRLSPAQQRAYCYDNAAELYRPTRLPPA